MVDFEHYGAEPQFRRADTRAAYGYGAATRSAYGQTPPQDPVQDRGAGNFGRVLSWAGALLSLGLVAGMGVWAWQLTVRDVSGVPVIRALEGPVRSLPADPGGAQAPHQGLAVNRIAEGDEAAPAPDRVVLAPAPVELEPIDPELLASGEDLDTQALIDRLLAREDAQLAPVAPPSDAMSDDALAPAPRPADTPPAADVAAAQTPEVIPASIPGVSRSLRPMVRPAALDTTATARVASSSQAQTGQPVASTDGVREIAPEDLPVGTRLVQLGAFDSAEIARSEWTRLAGQFPDYFAGRARIVQQAMSGGQQFFRLRADGFDSLDESRRFCAAMSARGAACIPVTIR